MTRPEAAFWATGDYERIAALVAELGTDLVAAAGVGPGDRVLDVAAGTGNAAIPAAMRGAAVTAIDITPALVDVGRGTSRRCRVEIEWLVGDAHDLPFPDGSFDAVVSAIGVMFARDRHRAATELLRVCRPGGTIALANWTPDGAAGEMFTILARHLGASGDGESPTRWGVDTRVAELLGPGCHPVVSVERSVDARFEGPPRALVDHYREHFAPVVLAYRELSGRPDEMAALDRDLLAWATRLFRQPPGGRYRYAYLQTVAVRR